MQEYIFSWKFSKGPLQLGIIVGLVFGVANLFLTWLYPLDDDSPGGLLRFYGPMFRPAPHVSRGAPQWPPSAGVTNDWRRLATFCVFDVLILLRVNLFRTTARATGGIRCCAMPAVDESSDVHKPQLQRAPSRLAASRSGRSRSDLWDSGSVCRSRRIWIGFDREFMADPLIRAAEFEERLAAICLGDGFSKTN
jgi:hypothetical protein